MNDYVVAVLQDCLNIDRAEHYSREWSQLSVRAFSRDWESDADAAYDDLA